MRKKIIKRGKKEGRKEGMDQETKEIGKEGEKIKKDGSRGEISKM